MPERRPIALLTAASSRIGERRAAQACPPPLTAQCRGRGVAVAVQCPGVTATRKWLLRGASGATSRAPER